MEFSCRFGRADPAAAPGRRRRRGRRHPGWADRRRRTWSRRAGPGCLWGLRFGTTSSCTIELITYVVGSVDLGKIAVGIEEDGSERAEQVALGRVNVVETMRPRFFDRPYRRGLNQLSDLYDQVLAGSVASGGGRRSRGSGKSWMCEEFVSSSRRRRGCDVVMAKHAKGYEAPHRILGDLLTALADDGRSAGDPADDVIRAVEHYDPALAAKATGAIRKTFAWLSRPRGM